MSNYPSGLPVRSESDGTDEKVITKIVDGQPGGTNQVQVDGDKNLHVEVHGNDPAGVDRVQILTEEGRSTSRGDYDVSSNTKPSSNASILHARVAAPTEVDQTFRPTGVASTDGSNAKAADVALRDESGNAFTAANPLPVTVVDSEGAEINNPNKITDLAKDTPTNHEYTVTALKTGKLTQVEASGSGKMQVDVSVETGAATGVFTRLKTKFSSTANPNLEFNFAEPPTVPAGAKIRVTITNIDNSPFDAYSTISLHEIP